MGVSYPQILITYRGHVLLSKAYRVPATLLLTTNDKELAGALGFESVPPTSFPVDFLYEKWVPAAEVDRWVERHMYGIYYDERVSIGYEDDATYFIIAHYKLPLLENTDKMIWEGTVPKRALDRVWIKETEKDLNRFKNAP